MPIIKPLAPGQAARTLAQRLSPIADRLRQLNTNLGIRPYRVFLTWTRFGGEKRGEGVETVVYRREILPTPKVASLDSTTFSLFHAGTVPVGSIKLSEISNVRWTEDLLRGLDPCAIPELAKAKTPGQPPPMDQGIPQPYDFFFEVVEDDRGGCEPFRFRYRLLNKPFRLPGKVMWQVMLEKCSEDRRTDDTSAYGGAPQLPSRT
jgi:hypothetical protein